jgi:hypothetical protein
MISSEFKEELIKYSELYVEIGILEKLLRVTIPAFTWVFPNKRMDFHAHSRCEESRQTQTGKNSPTMDWRVKPQFDCRISPIEFLELGHKSKAFHITVDSLHPSNLM